MECDVLIVGAGASGSVSALSLSQKNINVVVIEKGKEVGSDIRKRIDITEDFGIKEIIEELNLPLKEKTNETKWYSPTHEIFLKSDINDLFIKRGSFEDSFEVINMKKAVNNGVKLINNAKLSKINSKNNLVESVVINKKDKYHTIKPKLVIAADGTESMISKKFSKKLKLKNVNKLIAYGFYSKTIKIEPSITHIFFDSTNAPVGYFFLAKTKNGEGMACIVLEEKRLKRRAKEYFYEFISSKEILKKALVNVRDKIKICDYCKIDQINTRSIGNVLFVGEAGRLLDPLFGYGMRNSIISGFLAGKISYDYIKNEKETILDKYNEELDEMVKDIQESYPRRKIFNSLDNGDLDKIFSLLKDKGKIEKNVMSKEVRLGLELLAPIFE